jgi:hypothetical protein
MFCFVMQMLLDYILTEYGQLDVKRGHLDDATLVGNAAVLSEILNSIILMPILRVLGIVMRLDKCHFFFVGQRNNATEMELRLLYKIHYLARVSLIGINVLGVPIGIADYVQSHLFDTILPGLHKINDDLAKLQCPQVELFLWTTCGGTTRIAHLLRTIPPGQIGTFCQEVDIISALVLERCVSYNTLKDSDYWQAQLPHRLGGLGLISAESIQPAAYLGAIHAIQSVPSLLLPSTSVIIDDQVHSALQLYNQQVDNRDSIPTIEAFRNAKASNVLSKLFPVPSTDAHSTLS